MDTVFDFTEEEMFKTNFPGVLFMRGVMWSVAERVTDRSGHCTVKCHQWLMPAKFLHKNSDLDTGHVTYQDWIWFYDI